VNADARRKASLKAQSVNTFGKNYPNEYQTPTIQRNVKGFEKGDQMHHRAILSVFEPFFSGLNGTEKIAMVDELASMGVFTGNNPRNFTAIPSISDHQGGGGIHGLAEKYGIQIKGDNVRGTGKLRADNGELMPAANDFFEKIRNSTYDERIQALPDFINYGQDELDRILRDDLGFDVPTRQEQIAEYNRLVNKEHEEIVTQSLRQQVDQALEGKGLPRSGDRRAGAAIEALLALPDAHSGLLRRQALDGDINTSDQGKAVTVIADKVYMNKAINGNGKNGKH